MKRSDRTEIGGKKSNFTTTDWSRISVVRGEDDVRGQKALDEICDRYWKPVYCYLRQKGRDNARAKDLTQGFFLEIVIGRDLIGQADKAKGKFRTFLLTALDRYVINRHRADTAKKRAPEKRPVSLDGLEEWQQPELRHEPTAEEAYAYALASQLVDEVLASVEAYYKQSGRGEHWEVFRLTFIEPLWTSIPPRPLAEICEEFGISSAGKASNMCITVRRRFKKELRGRVRQSVVNDDEVDAEIRDLMEILSKSRAGK